MLYLSIRGKTFNKNVDPEVERVAKEGLYEWENDIKRRSGQQSGQNGSRGNIFEGEGVAEISGIDEETRKNLAENEKVKGNEAIRSGVY